MRLGMLEGACRVDDAEGFQLLKGVQGLVTGKRDGLDSILSIKLPQGVDEVRVTMGPSPRDDHHRVGCCEQALDEPAPERTRTADDQNAGLHGEPSFSEWSRRRAASSG